MFLLYGTSIMYTSLYCMWALYNTYKDPERKRPLFSAFFDFRNQKTVWLFRLVIVSFDVVLCSTSSWAFASLSTGSCHKCRTTTSTATCKVASTKYAPALIASTRS